MNTKLEREQAVANSISRILSINNQAAKFYEEAQLIEKDGQLRSHYMGLRNLHEKFNARLRAAIKRDSEALSRLLSNMPVSPKATHVFLRVQQLLRTKPSRVPILIDEVERRCLEELQYEMDTLGYDHSFRKAIDVAMMLLKSFQSSGRINNFSMPA